MSTSEQLARTGDRAFGLRSVVVAWLVAVGVDLLLNAGLFSPLFEQAREPALLSDEELFRRIPVAYLAILAGVAALAWVLDRLPRRGMAAGAVTGAAAGAVTAGLGVVSLWTAVDLTVAFVLAAIAVQVGQLTAAGAVLGGLPADPIPAPVHGGVPGRCAHDGRWRHRRPERSGRLRVAGAPRSGGAVTT